MSARHVRWVLLALTVGLLVVAILLPASLPRLVSWRWRPALALAIIASIRVRDELDVEARSGDLRAVVHRTMRPSHLSLWLPGSGDRP
jgi:hypothetical protein